MHIVTREDLDFAQQLQDLAGKLATLETQTPYSGVHTFVVQRLRAAAYELARARSALTTPRRERSFLKLH